MAQKLYFTPGPSALYPGVELAYIQALQENIASISHRGPQFQNIFTQAVTSLKTLLDVPENFYCLFLGSATETMERCVQNGAFQKTFHFVNGSFSKRFYEMSLQLGKNASRLTADDGKGFGIFTTAQIPPDTEMICVTQNETSTGVRVLLEDIAPLKELFPNALIALDITSSTPYISVDFSKIDTIFFSIQKGFGMPAGLGVWMFNEKFVKRSHEIQEKGGVIGTYHSIPELLEKAAKSQTPETPNVLALHVLSQVAKKMQEYGIEKIRKETEVKSSLLYDFFDNHPTYKPFVHNKKDRSQTVILVQTPNGSKPIIDALQKNDIYVGSGYGHSYKDVHIRIGNFPAHSVEDVENLIKTFKNSVDVL